MLSPLCTKENLSTSPRQARVVRQKLSSFRHKRILSKVGVTNEGEGIDGQRESGVEIVHALTASGGDVALKRICGDFRINPKRCLFQSTEARRGVRLGIQQAFIKSDVDIKYAKAYTAEQKSTVWIGFL